MNVETREILERWQFDIQIIDEENKENKEPYVLYIYILLYFINFICL